ncbi:hypothetical protein MC7420_1137 [Coleofasciculus chthonoplastes PCC 7420]|uniref:Uncharacterized protein n=1 Tax=Coleofasciculus chthonoplastes PCC 7420 TaxID=118168 RepID=B4VXE5_9CYAN|nr:hypothetical protein MC7420_1137 [Coleofasciculus chthonoplastes PCC 7420]
MSGFPLATVGAGLGGMVVTGMLVGNAHPTVYQGFQRFQKA